MWSGWVCEQKGLWRKIGSSKQGIAPQTYYGKYSHLDARIQTVLREVPRPLYCVHCQERIDELQHTRYIVHTDAHITPFALCIVCNNATCVQAVLHAVFKLPRGTVGIN